jgi:DNA-binding response OmpR family regulator
MTERAGAAVIPSVLVVEDELIVGMAVSAALRLAGNRIVGPTGSVRRALALAAEEHPDVALVDINLKGKPEGIAVAQTLTEKHGTTIVFLTARPDLARAARHHALGVVIKPYDIALIPSVVAAALRHRNGEALGKLPPFFEVFR